MKTLEQMRNMAVELLEKTTHMKDPRLELCSMIMKLVKEKDILENRIEDMEELYEVTYKETEKMQRYMDFVDDLYAKERVTEEELDALEMDPEQGKASKQLHHFITSVKLEKNWKSERKIVGEACEQYIKNTIKCMRCENTNFDKCKMTEQSKNLICVECNQKYQIQGKCATQKQINTIISKNIYKTLGGEYHSTIRNLHENIDYVIVLYEKNSYTVRKILYINHENINAFCFTPRKPLSATTKNPGWQGCNISFTHIKELE